MCESVGRFYILLKGQNKMQSLGSDVHNCLPLNTEEATSSYSKTAVPYVTLTHPSTCFTYTFTQGEISKMEKTNGAQKPVH